MARNLLSQEETIEFACVIKTICDEYGIRQNDLIVCPPEDDVIALTDRVKLKKHLIVNIPIPEEIAPKPNHPHLQLRVMRPLNQTEYDTSRMSKLPLGLGEFELEGLERPIRFWAWTGALDYYICGGRSAYFLEAKDLFHFRKTLKTWQKLHHKMIEPPVLPDEMLLDIYNNSIGFLLKGREQKEKYEQYKIPYKRGILLCGRPGCVTGDTKIQIRKKSDKGTHKIHDV